MFLFVRLSKADSSLSTKGGERIYYPSYRCPACPFGPAESQVRGFRGAIRRTCGGYRKCVSIISIYLSIDRSIDLSISFYLSFYLSIFSIYILDLFPDIYIVSLSISIYLTIYLSIIYLSLSIFLSIFLPLLSTSSFPISIATPRRALFPLVPCYLCIPAISLYIYIISISAIFPYVNFSICLFSYYYLPKKLFIYLW
jgi:hypothetical protein